MSEGNVRKRKQAEDDDEEVEHVMSVSDMQKEVKRLQQQIKVVADEIRARADGKLAILLENTTSKFVRKPNGDIYHAVTYKQLTMTANEGAYGGTYDHGNGIIMPFAGLIPIKNPVAGKITGDVVFVLQKWEHILDIIRVAGAEMGNSSSSSSS